MSGAECVEEWPVSDNRDAVSKSRELGVKRCGF